MLSWRTLKLLSQLCCVRKRSPWPKRTINDWSRLKGYSEKKSGSQELTNSQRGQLKLVWYVKPTAQITVLNACRCNHCHQSPHRLLWSIPNGRISASSERCLLQIPLSPCCSVYFSCRYRARVGPVVFIWRTISLTRRIQDKCKMIHSVVKFMMKFDHCLLKLLVRSLTYWQTPWQTDWSDYRHILMKDSVGTNWMLSGEGTLPVSLHPALHLL